MERQTFTDLHDQVLAAAGPRGIVTCDFGQMADGSLRSFALAVFEDDQDHAYRFITASPAKWAAAFKSWNCEKEAN